MSFQVADGEALGVIGQNGAGKSTLLKLLTGVILPDAGDVRVRGRITGLLELGTGFNPELTGEDNIHANGTLLGMERDELAAKRDAIVAFSELGRFIHEPIKTWSSGMVMRLAFSIAIHAEPDCFVIDEALSVGDAHFQQKCIARIRDFRAAGGSILFVSHDMNAVKMLCDRALLLDGGRVVEAGTPETVVNAYNFLVARLDASERHCLDDDRAAGDYGTGQVQISAVEVIGSGSRGATMSAGERAEIRLELQAREAVPDATVGILIRDRFGQDVFGTNSHQLDQPLTLVAGGRYRVVFRLAMALGPGKYTVTAAVHRQETHVDDCFHWRDRAAVFEIAGFSGQRFSGLCGLSAALECHDLAPADPEVAS